MIPPLLVQAALAAAIGGLVVLFGSAFSTMARARVAVARIRRRAAGFRVGGFAIVSGLVFATTADAIMWSASLARDDPGVVFPQLAAYGLIALGVAVVDAVVWWPERRSPATPAAAVG